MRVITTRAFGAYPKGHVIPEMPGNQARTMIRRGLVQEEKPVAPQKQKPAASRRPAK